MNKSIVRLFHFIPGILAYSLLAPATYAGAIKWIDDDGQVHYSDRVPTQYLNKGHSKLNDQGVTLSTTSAKKTRKELSAEQKLKNIKAAETRKKLIIARKKALRDRVLLYTFTTESDFDLARDARIEAIDSQISLAKTLIKNDEVKLTNVKGRISALEKNNRVPPQNLYEEINSLEKQINNNYVYIGEKSTERRKILEEFSEDLARFRLLKKEQADAREQRRKAAENEYE